jgi:hypothetical protein
MPKPDKPSKRPDTESGKPTIDQENHDQNVGQRQKSDATTEGGKPTIEEDNRGLNYGQRPGSTVAEDNDVE